MRAGECLGTDGTRAAAQCRIALLQLANVTLSLTRATDGVGAATKAVTFSISAPCFGGREPRDALR